MRRLALALLIALLIGAGGFVAGSRYTLRKVERWGAQVHAAGSSAVSRVSGYERYARIAACRPSRSPRWRVAVGERHACFVESRGRQATLQLGPDGVPQTAQVMWQPRTAAEALFERDSVRRAFLDDGGEYCRSQDGGGHLSEVWTVGAVRAVITVDTAPPFGPRVVVAAIDSLLAGCVDGPPR